MAAQLNIQKIRAKLDKIAKGFENRVAKVGWFPAAKYKDGTPVAYVASIQEFGASSVGVPARPAIRPTIQDKKGEWSKLIASGAKAVVQGRAAADDVLEAVGLQAAGDIGATLASGMFDPLSPVTLMLRKMRDDDPSLVVTRATVGEAARRVAAGEEGSARTQPLHDSGLLISSLTHQVGSDDA